MALNRLAGHSAEGKRFFLVLHLLNVGFMRELAHISAVEECAIMGQEEPLRKKYASDLTDEQWAIVGPLIPPAKHNPRGV